MAHHKSAKKRIRSDARKNEVNTAYMSKVRSAVKKVKNAATAGESGETLQKLFVEAQSQLHKAATKGILHKNNVSRRISRLAALVSKPK
ncbi:MAG: 30S ribosomal protein S20 [Oligoflexus sp.]